MSKNVFDLKPDSQIPPNDQQHLSQNYAIGNDIQTVKRYVYNRIKLNTVAFFRNVFISNIRLHYKNICFKQDLG